VPQVVVVAVSLSQRAGKGREGFSSGFLRKANLMPYLPKREAGNPTDEKTGGIFR
jgi:hypothetical protein